MADLVLLGANHPAAEGVCGDSIDVFSEVGDLLSWQGGHDVLVG